VWLQIGCERATGAATSAQWLPDRVQWRRRTTHSDSRLTLGPSWRLRVKRSRVCWRQWITGQRQSRRTAYVQLIARADELICQTAYRLCTHVALPIDDQSKGYYDYYATLSIRDHHS